MYTNVRYTTLKTALKTFMVNFDLIAHAH